MNEWFIMLIGVLLFLLGCAPSTTNKAIIAANSISEFATEAHEVVADSYKSEQTECVETSTTKDEATACVTSVRARYHPVWESYRAMRYAWLGLAASIQGAKLTDSELNASELLAMISRLAAAQEAFTKASGVLVNAFVP